MSTCMDRDAELLWLTGIRPVKETDVSPPATKGMDIEEIDQFEGFMADQQMTVHAAHCLLEFVRRVRNHLNDKPPVPDPWIPPQSFLKLAYKVPVQLQIERDGDVRIVKVTATIPMEGTASKPFTSSAEVYEGGSVSVAIDTNASWLLKQIENE